MLMLRKAGNEGEIHVTFHFHVAGYNACTRLGRRIALHEQPSS